MSVFLVEFSRPDFVGSRAWRRQARKSTVYPTNVSIGLGLAEYNTKALIEVN